MCYAIPGKIVEIKERLAVIDYFGEKRNVLKDFSDVKIGDYVYAQGGIIINKLEATEAKKILKFWKDKFFQLKKIDSQFTKVDDQKNISANLLAILQKVNLKQPLNNTELLSVLNIKKQQELNLLFQMANNLRQKELDNACCVHGIIEFSNYCQNGCWYCGIRKSSNISRYRLSLKEIIKIAKTAVNKFGFKALVLQSGEDYWYDEDKLIKLIKLIKELKVLIFLSIGERPIETYQKLYQAGARAILLRFETSNEKIFHRLRPKTTLANRLTLIKNLKKQGYLMATGFLIGLPGETKQDIVNNVLLTKSLNPDMYSFGPFIPVPETPLAENRMADKNLVLKTIALTRFLDPQAKILVTTALETIGQTAKKEGLLAGANSLMINVTPKIYKNKYAIYPNRPDLTIAKNIKETINLLYSIGRAPTDLGI